MFREQQEKHKSRESMASHFTSYYAKQISYILNQLSYIGYKISDILNSDVAYPIIDILYHI